LVYIPHGVFNSNSFIAAAIYGHKNSGCKAAVSLSHFCRLFRWDDYRADKVREPPESGNDDRENADDHRVYVKIFANPAADPGDYAVPL